MNLKATMKAAKVAVTIITDLLRTLANNQVGAVLLMRLMLCTAVVVWATKGGGH